ncbi:MAG: RsmD family RNA methyltransferase [Elusimicrobia bacterium]|nr:RsmD family RNA methyltransferase [Elusimicrobiota bacterium]
MRIIAGSAKGRRLKVPKRESQIRPILSRIRQSMFDSIRPKVMASNFLDLYAGTGIVGFEALSRGAQLVVFVDKGRESLKLIEANITLMKCQDKAIVHSGDVLGGALMLLKARLEGLDSRFRGNDGSGGILFDLVFVAPPYLGEDRRGSVLIMSVPTLQKLKDSRLLAPGAWVVVQHHQKEPWSSLPDGFKIYKKAKFGESLLTYLEWEK